MNKNKLKYIPIVGMFYGNPFFKNPTIPVDFKTDIKSKLEDFVKTLYHMITMGIVVIILMVITFLLTH